MLLMAITGGSCRSIVAGSSQDGGQIADDEEPEPAAERKHS